MNISQMRNLLSLDQLRARVPSAFAQEASSTVGEHYEFMPSGEMVEYLDRQGYKAFYAHESRTKIEEKQGKTKHVIKWLHPDYRVGGNSKVGDTYAGLTTTNAHDGTSSWKMLDSAWEQACGNGNLIILSNDSILSLRHSSNGLARLALELPNAINRVQIISKAIEELADIEINEKEAITFARMALELRWPSIDNDAGVTISTAPIKAEMVLNPRHGERIDNLWGLSQVAEENINQGGITYFGTNGRRNTTRAIQNVDADLRLHKGLSTLVQAVADSKR